MAPTLAASAAGYRALWAKCQIIPSRLNEVHQRCGLILGNKARYQAIEKITSVPWFVVAALHSRESDCDFNTYLGNGDPIYRRTTDVPAGRGPFATFEAGAEDALALDGLSSVKVWPVEACLYYPERFNGWGYYSVGENSPYVWAATNLQQAGKYVGDGAFSRTAWDTQLGVAAILKGLVAMDTDIGIPVAA